MYDSPKPKIERMWINQPSTLQTSHKFHGKNVLAYFYGDGKEVTVYFLDGDIHSTDVDKIALSKGWRK